jgi:hypothetical protein
MPGVVETTNTFATNDVITSTAMNNIIDQTLFTSDALSGSTLALVAGKMKVATSGITSNEMGVGAVTTNAIADGAVTQAKASNMLIPAGAIMPFAMNGAPTGWLAADGTAVSRSTYATLFAAIATTYGVGDGATTFNVPDLRGYFVRGTGTNSDGTVSGTFAAKQADSVGSHTHPNTVTEGELGLGSGGYRYDPFQDGGDREFKANFSSPSNTGTTETRPKNIAMFYCIKI